MAVIVRCENGFLVDHQRIISESVSALSLSCKDSFFALLEPYFRSSDSSNSRKRKRKKSMTSDQTEEDKEAALYHKKVRGTILEAVENLVRIGIEKGYFLSRDGHIKEDKCTAVPDKNMPNSNNLLGRVISHVKEEPAVLNICGQQYIIPAQCTFLMSDASNLQPLVDHAQQNGLYNLVVLDPPWYNKSARRGSKYSFMSLWQIKSLPVPQLLSPRALVVIWVTNKQKYIRFTKSELFPHWSVELVAEWHWIKVTRRGELVADLDSSHKKPYEPLLIGQFRPKGDSLGTYSNFVMDGAPDKDNMEHSLEQSEFWSESSLRMKRKRPSNECVRDCCRKDSGKMTTAGNQVPISSLSVNHALFFESKNVQLHDVLQAFSTQNSCENSLRVPKRKQENLSDKVESLNDVVKVSDLHLNKSVCKLGTNISVERNGRKPDIPLDSLEFTRRGCQRMPHEQVICSVPCRIHSRKPPLKEILSSYIPTNSRCLEMFARNLTPHWTSWGNEVLKFQSMDYFEQMPVNEKRSQTSE